mgnify:FL=1
MAERTSQKLKLLYLMKILLQKTDETHGITMPEIISELNAYGISAERKGLYNDMECLRTYGMEIAGYQEERAYYYKVVDRQFELAELKLLVDSVQSAKFITTKKSRELIEKITGLASKYEATQLNRQVYMTERIKTKNEGIYYNIDAIYNAIAENVKITFQYFQWNIKKQMELRHDGALYQVSPWALSWDDDNYYLIAYDEKEEKIKHFRVDKMLHIVMTEEKREGRWVFKEFDIAVYARKMFGMFDGEEEMVKILCHNSLAGVMIDRFGKDISLIPVDEEHFSVTVRVAVSRQFLSWVMALGEGAKIIGPDIVVEQVKTEVERLVKQYL